MADSALLAEVTAEVNKPIVVTLIGEGEYKELQDTQTVKKNYDMGTFLQKIRGAFDDIGQKPLVPFFHQFVFVGDSFIPGPKEKLADLHQKYKNGEGVLVMRMAPQEIYG